MATHIPPVPEGATKLSRALMIAFDSTVKMYRLQEGDVMVGLGAATVTILIEVANQMGYDPKILLERYSDSLKLPVGKGDGK